MVSSQTVEQKPRALSAFPFLCSLFILFAFFFSGHWAFGQEYLVGPDTPWLITKGKKAQPADWNAIDFEPTAEWFEGVAPIGYDTNNPTGPKTVLNDMRQGGGNPGYFSIFLRAEFELADPFPLKTLVLKVVYDDGFVAYLNGEGVAYGNMPTANNPPYNVPASNAIEPTQATFDLTSKLDLLVPGKNVLAVQVHNANLTSSDLWWEATLEAEYSPNPFPCLDNVTCQDLGDGAVGFTWKLPTSAVEQILIREEGNEDPLLAVEGNASEAVLRGVAAGDHIFRVFAVKGGQECYGGICVVSVSPIQEFRRGDVNDDGKVNLVDPLFLAHYLFQEGEEPTCLDAGDANDDGKLNVSDVIYILTYLFDMGSEPAPPGPKECGPDDQLDSLPKCEYTSCPTE